MKDLCGEPNIRWTIQRDLRSLLEIERGRESGCEWTIETFDAVLKQRDMIGLIAEDDGCVVGTMLYQLQRGHLRLRYLCVHPEYRRCGVGYTLIEKLKTKLSNQRRTQIQMIVRETQLSLQLFLRAQGFIATQVLRRHFDDTGEDGYRMCYPHDAAVQREVQDDG